MKSSLRFAVAVLIIPVFSAGCSTTSQIKSHLEDGDQIGEPQRTVRGTKITYIFELKPPNPTNMSALVDKVEINTVETKTQFKRVKKTVEERTCRPLWHDDQCEFNTWNFIVAHVFLIGFVFDLHLLKEHRETVEIQKPDTLIDQTTEKSVTKEEVVAPVPASGEEAFLTLWNKDFPDKKISASSKISERNATWDVNFKDVIAKQGLLTFDVSVSETRQSFLFDPGPLRLRFANAEQLLIDEQKDKEQAEISKIQDLCNDIAQTKQLQQVVDNEMKVGARSGYVNKTTIHQATEGIIFIEERIKKEKVAYKKKTGKNITTATCKQFKNDD